MQGNKLKILLNDGKRAIEVPKNANPATRELCLFWAEDSEHKFHHLARAIDQLWNAQQPDAFMWNEWSELMMQTFCEEEWITITAAAAAWKTTSAALFCLASWYSSPHDTVVICTSTTLPGLRRRIWKEITRYWRIQPCMGHPIQSQNCIQWRKGSDDAGIFGIACDIGEINKAVGKIIGFHAPNVVVVVDEMPYTSEAIVEACTNLRTGCERFKFIGLGNADDPSDPHGRACEPENGWDSINPEMQSWRTRRGICLHLDARESPNVKAGKILYPGLVNQQDIDNTIHDYGEDSPQFWAQRRGFWAPEGVQKTVLSWPMLTKFKAMEKPVWISGFSQGAALDPSFEGRDRCVLRFLKCGEIEVDGQPRLTVDLGEYTLLKVKASQNPDDEDIHYQIMRQCRDECEKRGIEPNMFAYDSTGEGGGLGSIIAREWSPRILGVEFGGKASDRPVSEINPRPSHQEYFNKVTELWIGGIKVLVMNGQVRGMDRDTANEFCKRQYEMKGKLMMVETKTKMKARMGRSPDLADSAVIGVELFRTRMGLMTASGVIGKKATDDFTDFAKKMDFSSDPDNYLIEAEY